MAKPFKEIPTIDVSVMDGAFWHGELSATMAQLAEEHGPVFRWVARSDEEAGQERVTMAGPEANRFVMNTQRQAFSHEIGWSPLINETLGRGLLTMDDPEHAVHRRMWNPAFAASYMGTYLPIMQRVIEERTATWPERSAIDLYSEAREITFDIAAAALAGFNRGEEVDRMRKLFYTLLHGYDSSIPFDEFVAGFYGARNRLFEILAQMIEERRATPVEARPRDVLSLILEARDDEGKTLSTEQVLGHLNILLVAGHETTTTLSAWEQLWSAA